MPKRKKSSTSSANTSTSSSASDSDVSIAVKTARPSLGKNENRKLLKENSLKMFTALLTVSGKYSEIWQERLEAIQAAYDSSNKENGDPSGKDKKKKSANVHIEKQLTYFKGKLKDYQVYGISWMKHLLLGGINGILADEMGLGKTVQIVALICHLIEIKYGGPHLIIAPLPTIGNWEFELKRFAPDLPYLILHGNKQERNRIMKESKKLHTVGDLKLRPIIVTNFETIIIEFKFFESVLWKYVVIDEAQRIKNHESKLGIAIRALRCGNKMLLTGTPLQNNLTELWALLNFIMPTLFDNVSAFSSLFILDDLEEMNIRQDSEETSTVVASIHGMLAPFMLRRLKQDVLDDIPPKKEVLVYCPMTAVQKELYSHVLQRNMNILKGTAEAEDINLNSPRKKRKCTRLKSYATDLGDSSDEDHVFVEKLRNDVLLKIKEELVDVPDEHLHYYHRITMMNIPMMYRKIVCHPYLVSAPLDPKYKGAILINEDLVSTSGKMLVLDAMLNKLLKGGHKVLIYSTLKIMLNLIEEYMHVRNYEHRRLDGDSSLEEKQKNIDDFNSDPNIFAFLISTRAGSLGINLAAADTVIFFDRDWNPQVDIQAQDRCHRIGQTRPVMVYTLVTKNTIDETVLEKGKKKLRLEKLVIKDGKFGKTKSAGESNELMATLLKMLEDDKAENVIHPNGYVFTNEELDNLLDRSELIEQFEKSKKEKLEAKKKAEEAPQAQPVASTSRSVLTEIV